MALPTQDVYRFRPCRHMNHPSHTEANLATNIETLKLYVLKGKSTPNNLAKILNDALHGRTTLNGGQVRTDYRDQAQSTRSPPLYVILLALYNPINYESLEPSSSSS